MIQTTQHQNQIQTNSPQFINQDSSQNVLICKVILPAAPIEYHKLVYPYNSSIMLYQAIILCNNKKLCENNEYYLKLNIRNKKLPLN